MTAAVYHGRTVVDVGHPINPSRHVAQTFCASASPMPHRAPFSAFFTIECFIIRHGIGLGCEPVLGSVPWQ